MGIMITLDLSPLYIVVMPISLKFNIYARIILVFYQSLQRVSMLARRMAPISLPVIVHRSSYRYDVISSFPGPDMLCSDSLMLQYNQVVQTSWQTRLATC